MGQHGQERRQYAGHTGHHEQQQFSSHADSLARGGSGSHKRTRYFTLGRELVTRLSSPKNVASTTWTEDARAVSVGDGIGTKEARPTCVHAPCGTSRPRFTRILSATLLSAEEHRLLKAICFPLKNHYPSSGIILVSTLIDAVTVSVGDAAAFLNPFILVGHREGGAGSAIITRNDTQSAPLARPLLFRRDSPMPRCRAVRANCPMITPPIAPAATGAFRQADG